MRELWELAGFVPTEVFDEIDMGTLYDELDELGQDLQNTINQIEENKNNEFEMLVKGYFICNKNYERDRNVTSIPDKAELGAGDLKDAIIKIEKAISIFQKSLLEIHRSVLLKLMDFVQFSGHEYDAEKSEYIKTNNEFEDIIDKSNVQKYFCSQLGYWMFNQTQEPSSSSNEEPTDLLSPPRIIELDCLKSVFRILRENAEREQPARRGYREKKQKTFDRKLIEGLYSIIHGLRTYP